VETDKKTNVETVQTTPKKVPLNRSLDYMNLSDKDNDGYYDSTQTAVDQTKKAKTLVDDIISDVILKGKKDSRIPFSYSDNAKFDVLLRKERGNGNKELIVNKSFFNKSDEDAVGLLQAQFGDAFDFEETSMLGVIGEKAVGGYGSFSAVKISTKDGKHSKTIEFEIGDREDFSGIDSILKKIKSDPRGKDSLNTVEKSLLISYENQEKAYEKSYNDLTSFIDTHVSKEITGKINKQEQKNAAVYKKWNDWIEPDREEIESKYRVPNPNYSFLLPDSESNAEKIIKKDLFTQIIKTTYTPTGKEGTGIYKEVKKTQPYKEELIQAMKILKVNSLTPEVKEYAVDLIIEKERIELKRSRTTEALEALEDGEILPVSLAEYSGDTDALKAILTVGAEMFSKEYAVKLDIFENTIKELETSPDIKDFTTISQQLSNPDYNFEIKEGEPTVYLEDGREVPKRITDNYEKERLRLRPKYDNFFMLQNDLVDGRYAIQDNEAQLDLLKRDYNDLERFGVTIGVGFAELAVNIGGASENIEAHKRWASAKARLQETRDEYARPIAYENAFDNWTNFGKFITVELGNQIPIFTALAIPYVGWGTLLASSYGEQYGTMTAEEIESLGLKDYSIFEKALTSAGYAVPELAFELVTTVPLLRGAGNALKGALGTKIRDLTLQGVKEGVQNQMPTFVRGSLLGSLGEGATTLTQNLVTGKPWHENVEHSLFSGLMFETSLASVPIVSGAIVNKLSDYSQNAKFRENLESINEIIAGNRVLSRKIKAAEKLGKDSSVIEQLKTEKKNSESKIKELQQDNTKILQEQKEGITGRWLGWGKNNKEGMSAGAFKAYLVVTTQQEQLRIQAKKILDSDYSDEVKAKKLKDLKDNGFTDASGRKYYGFNALQSARDLFRTEKNSEFNLWRADKNNEEALNVYLEKAQDYIDNKDADRVPGWVKNLEKNLKNKDDVARILFNIDKINENLKSASKKTNLEKNLEVYQTVEEAVSKLTELGTVSESDIKSIEDGSHGIYISPSNSKSTTKSSYIVIENMAKDDRLETKTHELSHRLLGSAIAENADAFKEISETIFEWAKANDQKLYARLVRQKLMIDSAPDEIIAMFLEEAAAERIDFKKKGIAGIIGYMTSGIMKKDYGFDMDLAGESDAIKMLIGLGRKIKAGTLTLKDEKAIVKNKSFADAKKIGKILYTLPDGATKLSKKEGSQTTVKNDLFTETNSALIEALELYGMKNPERLLSEDVNVRRELAKEWEALGDSRLWIGTVIGEKWRKFIEVNYLSKRDKAANYKEFKGEILDVVTTGIETGDNGIPFLVRSWNPAKEDGRTLTSHIYGEIGIRLMGNNGIIDRKFPQLDKFTSIIDSSMEDGGISISGDLDIDTVLEMEDKKEERRERLEEDRYRKLIGVNDEFASKIKKEIKEVLLSENLGLISDFDWTQRFSKASQEKLFTIIKEEMKDYEAFLKKTRVPFIKHAHTSDLVQMERSEKDKIFTRLKAVNASPNKIKLALLEGLIQPFEVKSMTQGPNIYEKINTGEQQFIDFMKVRGRKDAFVKNNINIMAMDAVFDVLLNETIEVNGKQVEVLEEFIRIQREKGLPSVSNVLSIVKERINRDQDVKFSKTVRDFNNIDLRIFYGKLNDFGGKIDLINVGDEEAVRRAVEETWGDYYSKAVIKSLSKDLHTLIKRYAVIDKNHANLKTKPEQQLNEYLYNNLKAAELELNLAEFLQIKDDKGKLIKLSTLFDDTSRLNKQRYEIVEFGKKLIEKYGEKQALMMMIHASGMYSTSTKVSRGNHVENNGILTKVEGKIADFGSQRYQSFAGKKDWNTNVMQVLFPNISLTKSKNLSKYQNVTNEKGEVEKINTTLLAESSKEGIKDRNFTARKAQAKLSELFVRDIAQYYKDRIEAKNPSLDKKDFAMLMMSMASNMQSPLKRAANLKYIYKNKKGKKYKGKLRYEHMIPTNYMVMKLTDAFMGNKSNVDLDALFEEYTVAIIPVTMDGIMEEMGFVNTMPIGFAAGQSSRIRYYNMSTYGHPDLYAIESIDPRDNGQVYGEAVANLEITTFKKGNKFSKALGEATIISRTVNPAKGISVLDFDDTLATTKSGVRYTLPNPDGTPQPKKKVIFMAGGPGSGKSNVINQLGLKEQGFKVVNQDISLEWLMKNHGMPTDMREFTPEQASEFGKLSAQAREIALKKRIKYQGEGDGVVIDGTGASLNVMKKNIQDFKDKGYDVQMIFVETSQETALSRNKARKERSLRTGIVIKNYDSVQANKEAYKELFGERFAEVNTDNLKQGDVMPADVVNKVNDFTSGYIKGRLNAGEYATKGEELRQQGAEFDFSEFNQVVEGKTAPLFNKAMKLQEKFTSKDMFVLTARPAESNQAIFEFLQANGLKIPMENIIGLGSSASSDKALWIAGKVGEGYNDFYFADDILENVQAVSDMLDQFDVKSKVQQAKRDFVLGDPKVTKLLDEKSMNDVKDVDGLANPGVYSNVKFSKSHRAEYENTVAKNRPDLSSKEVTATIDKMFDYIDGLDVPNKRKYEQITTKWLATSNIKLPEDSYKIQQAVEIAELKKEDIFSYKNPNEIIEKYAGTIKAKPISPVGIKEFTRATGFNDPITTEYGIVEYEVEETREAQQKVRDIVNTHWGPNSNPWCITKIDKDGNLSEDAWRDWTSYGKGPKRIVFQNGKLLAMKANYEYWGKMNKHSEGPIIQVKEGNVTNTTELVVGDGGIVDPIIRETRTVSKDGNTVTTNIFENSQDGYADGTTIVENRIKGVKTKETRFDPDGSKVNTQEFNKKGKPTTSYQFNPNGKVKSVNGHLQQQAITEAGLEADVVLLNNELVVRVGDIIENNYTETETDGTTTDYFYGRALVGDQVMEIGFESKTGLDLADVTKTVNGKTRLDIGKVIREVDPNVKGLPKTGVKFSKGISKEFNDIIEQSTGVGSEKVFSDAQAKIRGNKRRFDNIVPYSVQDLMGLLYNFVGRGKAGEQHMEFFKKALIDPFARAINELNQSKQSSAGDYSNLTKAFPNVKKKLNKEIEGGDYTYDQAIRVYLWNKAGFEVPGLSKRDLNALDSIVKNDPELQAFADTLGLISKKEEGYGEPSEYWLVENIASDLLSDGSIGDARSEFLAEWQQNADEMFSKENLNKIQAIYGNKFREALEDILYRMKHGTNRPTGSSRLTNNFMNWINNSTGAIMFFNMRSALLQTLSTTNYINWTDNNPLKAAMAFANQKQYWSDFSALFNSDFLKQRRSGNQRSINEAELTTAVANSDNKAKAAIAWLLQKGFLPTQIMDSFAISSGGATFYRNRINKYIKEGMSPEQAQEKAFLDFQEITEATQQSARPDMISQQQASPLGRLILSFQNTPMQYARIMNKAARDIVNGRGDQKSNISKIVYYGALQSIIFAALQSAIFASLGDDEEEEFDKKKQRIVGSMVDGWLAGLGVAGKAIGTIERSIKEYLKQKERGFNADHAQTIIQLLGFSPPIGSKLRKIYSAIQTEEFNKGVSEKRGFTLDNPTWSSWGNVIEGFTNIPLGRISNKLLNIDNALDSQNQWWERAALLLGWNTWDLGIKDPDITAVKGEIKEERKVEKKKEAVIKKEEKKQEIKEENISKEKANIELQKKEIEDGNESPDCAAINKRGERCGTKIEKGSTYCTIHTKVEQNDGGKKTQCGKTKKDGKRCKMQTSNKSGYCYYHD
jgi:predicted kinase